MTNYDFNTSYTYIRKLMRVKGEPPETVITKSICHIFTNLKCHILFCLICFNLTPLAKAFLQG